MNNCFDVIRGGLPQIKTSTGYERLDISNNGAAADTKVPPKLEHIEGGRHDDNLEVGTPLDKQL